MVCHIAARKQSGEGRHFQFTQQIACQFFLWQGEWYKEGKLSHAAIVGQLHDLPPSRSLSACDLYWICRGK
jgi:hypothetical protein